MTFHSCIFIIPDKKDRESLVQALDLSKDILQNVNEQIAVSERQMRLNDIYARLDGRSYATHRGKKFKVSLVHCNYLTGKSIIVII